MVKSEHKSISNQIFPPNIHLGVNTAFSLCIGDFSLTLFAGYTLTPVGGDKLYVLISESLNESLNLFVQKH